MTKVPVLAVFRYLLILFLISYFHSPAKGQGEVPPATENWKNVLANKAGTLAVTWYTSKPFIYRDDQGQLAGIEYEILIGFQQYIKEKYGVTISIAWWENESFSGTYNTVKESNQSGLLGISAFSITPQRQQEVGFAPPYMSDISVLISSDDVPIVDNTAEFKKVFNKLKAITIEGTTYAQDLEVLKKQYDLDFDIEYIPSSENIQRTIEQMDGAFGFIDVPIYLTEFRRNSSVGVKRQNLFPIKRIGYSVIMPLESDWRVPLEQYFLSQAFKSKRDQIIGKYIDREVYEFIRSLQATANEDVFLLTKEKEIQNEALKGKTEQIEREMVLRNYLITGVIVILFFLMILARMYFIRYRTTILLEQQKEKIQSQRQDIENQKVELQNHNSRLIDLNEEKNHLIQILAHDLRAPINQMTGLTQLLMLEKERLSDTQLNATENIHVASSRLSGMISKILDVDKIENTVDVLHIEPIPLDNFLKGIIDRFTIEAQKKELHLLYENKLNVQVMADEVHLTQIIENLLSNAIKFSPPHKKILVDVLSKDGFVQVRITDEGPGFTEQDKRKMFRKFQKLSAKPTGQESSTGLGLSIVKKYADMMKLNVTLESNPGRGSSFTITFNKEQSV